MTQNRTPYFQRDGITLYHGDCREIALSLPKVDLVLTDPPYGITANDWDIAPDLRLWFDSMWTVCNGPVIFTACQPFTSKAVCSQEEFFRHEWIWKKSKGSNFANTVREPFKEHESVLVFARKAWKYNPQMQERSAAGRDRVRYKISQRTSSTNYRDFPDRLDRDLKEMRIPSSVQEFVNEKGLHPTQKPVKLFRYLAATYSDETDIILDPFAGSGTTLRAAADTGRRAIGIEINEEFCEIAARRFEQPTLQFS